MVTHTLNADEFIPKYAAVSVNENGRLVNTNWPNDISVSNCIGLSISNDSVLGSAVEVCLFGVVTNPNWDFEPLKPVFCYYTGGLTQKILGEAVLKVGKALSKTSVLVTVSDMMLLV